MLGEKMGSMTATTTTKRCLQMDYQNLRQRVKVLESLLE